MAKKKEKKKKWIKKITINTGNKKGNSLIAQIKRWQVCFHKGFGTFQSFIKFKNKNRRTIKVQKSKTWGISRWSPSLSYLLTSHHVSLIILQNPLHVILQLLLVACSGVDIFGRNNVFCHLTAWPSFTNLDHDPTCEHCGVEGTLITRSSLMLSKLPWDTTSGVVSAATKPN